MPTGKSGKMDLFGNVFAGKRILVTGDTGFKGSWLCIWLKSLGADVYGYALPPKTVKDNFVTTGLAEKITHQDGDIRDLEKMKTFFQKVNPEIVFHMAAQPLVLYSYENPVETFSTNVMGTVHLFECVKATPSVKVVLNITSDKCYDNKEWVWGYRENDPMGGKDPYSASKGCAELVFNSYLHSFFQKPGSPAMASGRAGNVIGGGDWAADRIIPDVFRAVESHSDLTVRNPQATRPWQFVLEPIYGYMKLAEKLLADPQRFSGGWNFGPLDNNNYSVADLLDQLKKKVKLKTSYPENGEKPHEAHLLKLDISKAVTLLKWQPLLNFEQTLDFTIEGYMAEIEGNKNLYEARVAQINAYTAHFNKEKKK
jgi:CDP-glucose 4,6-dehydratase